MPPSQITQQELEALQSSGLCKKTPFLVKGISKTQLSISRHFGVCRLHGVMYTYLPETDELIRADVAKWLKNHRKIAVKKALAEGMELQGKIF